MTGFARLAFAIVLAAAATAGCSGAGGANPTGTGGTGGGGGTGGAGATFIAVAPCSLESSYNTVATTVMFGGPDGNNYNPPCLAVSAGTSVIFSGDFLMHPLTPSTMRGTMTGNPIVSLASGDKLAIEFADPGFYAYFCSTHGSDDGQSMAGVVWAK